MSAAQGREGAAEAGRLGWAAAQEKGRGGRNGGPAGKLGQQAESEEKRRRKKILLFFFYSTFPNSFSKGF
jgi:hypothetical protein